MYIDVSNSYSVTVGGQKETRKASIGSVRVPSTISLTPNEEKTLEQAASLFVRTLFDATKRRESERFSYESLKVERLMFERDDHRSARKFSLADLLRDKIENMGWSVRDYPDRSEAVPKNDQSMIRENFIGEISFAT